MKLTPKLPNQAPGIFSGKHRRTNKYGAKKTEYMGRMYDSRGEANRAAQLEGLRLAGLIKWWHPKPGSFHLGCPENVYRPDFMVFPILGEPPYVEDYKGTMTAKFRHDVKLWAKYGPCELRIVTPKGTEVIAPEGKR